MVHLEHKGSLLMLPLDIVELAQSHTGVELVAVFATVLKEYNLTKKVLAVMCDNASNNDVMIRELTDHTDVDDEQQELTDDPDMEDLPSNAAATDESDDEDAATDNDDGFVDEVEKMDEAEKELHKYMIRPVKVILVKLQKISFKIINSTTILLPMWKQILKDVNGKEPSYHGMSQHGGI
ncbi:hypothetical protein APHAL10511_005773 [Amanita phalloides]|nr:hypothetical protein APHAL10511_005773 [Amanita phalloides]